MNKILALAILPLLLCGCGNAATNRQVGNTIISILDASRLYGCVVGMYGEPIERIIGECGPGAADLVRDVNTDLQIFQAKRMACPTEKKK